MFGKLFGRKKDPLEALQRHFERRPLVAYEIAQYKSSEEPRYSVYCESYGLEMTIDDEWPVDTVLFTTPDLVQVITKETGVTTMGTVYAGALSAPADGNLKTLTDQSAKWLLIQVTAQNEAGSLTQIKAASQAGLNIVARLSNTSLVSKLPVGLKTELVVAISKGDDSATTQARALEVRKLLGAERAKSTRVIIAGKFDKAKAIEMLRLPAADGVFIDAGNSAEVLTVIVAAWKLQK